MGYSMQWFLSSLRGVLQLADEEYFRNSRIVYLFSLYYIEVAVICLRVHLLNFRQHSIAEKKNNVSLDNTMSQLTSMVADWI